MEALNLKAHAETRAGQQGVRLEAHAPKREPTAHMLLRPVVMMQIGLGPHWARTIRKHLRELRAEGQNVICPVGVELASARRSVTARMSEVEDGCPDEVVYVEPISPYHLDARTEVTLNRLIRKHGITAVAVSVPPEAHLTYALWALRNGLSLFLDKPVSTRPDAVNSLSAARGILADFDELCDAYSRARIEKPVCAMLNAQRPFMPVFAKVVDCLREVLEATGQPLTNITAAHADGQMRVGGELVDVGYHGYLTGNGKLSHSGYHLVDMLARALKAGTRADARPDYLLVRSSFRQPDALVTAMPRTQWRKLFGDSCPNLESYSDDELLELGRRMGEVDAHVSIEAIRNGAVMTTASVHLQHDTVSARASLAPPSNWYKGSGRLKRELWHFDQGPMQSLRLETLQADDLHDRPEAKGDDIGDPNHLELVRVLNDGLLAGSSRFSRFTGADLAGEAGAQLLSERAKRASLREFVACASGQMPVELLTSDLATHRLGVAIMAAAYESHVRRGVDRMGAADVRVDWIE